MNRPHAGRTYANRLNVMA